jgi:cell fate regulator YaaT (PSP1 superfamily)
MNGEASTNIVQVEFKGERREYFLNAKHLPLAEGEFVVVQVERGRDIGKAVRLGEALDKMAKARPVTQEVLRKATDEDLARYTEIQRKEEDARRICEDKIRERDLKMKLVDVEYQLDSSKITFFFTAEERVDFRDLVKDLAGIYKTRIELRQIGVRDEAKRLGGYGSCGRKFCCTTFLQEFEPVTLKMARDQSLSVSPTKISGACGRLMCCLAYERDYYMDVARQLPKIGSRVTTPYGEATVTKIDIFAQAVTVEDDTKNEMRFTLDQIKRIAVSDRPAAPKPPEGREGRGGGGRWGRRRRGGGRGEEESVAGTGGAGDVGDVGDVGVEEGGATDQGAVGGGPGVEQPEAAEGSESAESGQGGQGGDSADSADSNDSRDARDDS